MSCLKSIIQWRHRIERVALTEGQSTFRTVCCLHLIRTIKRIAKGSSFLVNTLRECQRSSRKKPNLSRVAHCPSVDGPC